MNKWTRFFQLRPVLLPNCNYNGISKFVTFHLIKYPSNQFVLPNVPNINFVRNYAKSKDKKKEKSTYLVSFKRNTFMKRNLQQKGRYK